MKAAAYREFLDSLSASHRTHISINDKCFWAGEQSGQFILHHNKLVVGGEEEDSIISRA